MSGLAGVTISSVERYPLAHFFAELCEIVLGNLEIGVNRILELDIYQGRSASSNVISRINETSTGSSVIRRTNIAIFQVESSKFDGRLILSDGALQVLNLGTIGVYLLRRNEMSRSGLTSRGRFLWSNPSCA